MTHTLTIDRIEADQAVVEFNGTTFDLPVALLPAGVREGQRIALNTSLATDADTRAAEERLERLRQTGPSGDTIDL